MGGIYPKLEKAGGNDRGGPEVFNETQALSAGAFPSVYHPTGIPRLPHTDYGGAFSRSLPQGLSANVPSYSLPPGTRPRDKSNEEMLNYRFLPDSSAFQTHNMSMSPNTILQNQFKHQANVINSLNQNRSAAVLQQLNEKKFIAVTKNESFQGTQLLQSGSKLNVDVTNRIKPSNYPINQQQHVQQTGMFQGSKRPQLLSQPPHKRSRLTNDFVNMSHHSPSSIHQGHHLSLSSQDGLRLSSSPQKFGQNDSSLYKGSLMNQSKSHLSEPRGVWPNKEPAYYPQVEAISPVPEDMKHCDSKAFTEKDEIGEKLRIVDGDIIKQEQNISRLQEKIDFLNSKINKPNLENYSKEDETFTPSSRDPIQSIITDNQHKATEQHQLFHKLCSNSVSWNPLALPLYRQQGDVDLVMKVKSHFHKTFKQHLIKYIRRRKFADKARMKFMADSYEVSAKAWYKRLEKSLNSTKRRQKESKFRELFERTYPEIKRNREERERENGDYNDPSSCTGDNSSNATTNINNHRSLTNNFNNNSSSDTQRPSSPYDAVKEMEKMKEYAIDPPLTVSTWHKNHNIIGYGILVKDPKGRHSNYQNFKPLWSREEIDIFKEQYIITPKNFARIASFLPKKSVSKCVHYYYLTKKSVNYKALVKKHARRRRDKAERQQRYRVEGDHQTHHPTGDLIIPHTSDSLESTKFEPLLSKNIMEFNNLIKEEQNNSFNQDNDNQNLSKESEDKNINVAENTKYNTSNKNNKNNNSSCSDPNLFNKNNRGPDNDDDDESYRGHFSCDFNKDVDSTRIFESSKTVNETEKDKNGNRNVDNNYNSSRQFSDLDIKTDMNVSNKHDIIHIKDAIEFSIEQNLSQNIESNVNKVFEKKSYENVSRSADNSFMFPGINEDDSAWKKNDPLDNNDSNLKYSYFPQKFNDNSSFQDPTKEVGNCENPMRFNSSFNRAILLKDFRTAQIMNQSPINSSGNSKLQALSFPTSNSSLYIDSSRSILPEQLPIVETYKSKITSNLDSMDPYLSNIAGLSKTSMASRKKSDFFIDRVSKLYEEEVEPYTDEFRNRSDSQRTRTSSEASEMYAYIKNRNQKNIHSSKQLQIVTNSLNDKVQNTVIDSRIKMPPPDVTDQKVFRSQKSSFSSKKNPYLKSHISRESLLIVDNNYHSTKATTEEFQSSTNNIIENALKRKTVTAANIIDSLTDKLVTTDNDVKVISTTLKSSEKSFSKIIDMSDEKFSPKMSLQNNSQMTLDGHIKQLIVDDFDSGKRSDTSNEICKVTMKDRNEIGRHAKYNMPLKKREKQVSTDNNSQDILKVGHKSHTSSSYHKSSSNPSECYNVTISQVVESNNNNVSYKERMDVSIVENYDSQFSSPGKLLIDLDVIS